MIVDVDQRVDMVIGKRFEGFFLRDSELETLKKFLVFQVQNEELKVASKRNLKIICDDLEKAEKVGRQIVWALYDLFQESGIAIQGMEVKEFDLANDKTFSIIEQFFADGYQKNLANLIYYLPQVRREKALEKLPQTVRENVMKILKDWGEKQNLNPEVLSAVGGVLKNSDFYGEKAANEVLESLDYKSKRYLDAELQNQYKINPLLALNVFYNDKEKMDILVDLDDRALQRWLREVEQLDLAMALLISSDRIKNKIFSNMSKRAQTLLKEDMEFMGPVYKTDILEKQAKLLGILNQLADNGEIILPEYFCNSMTSFMNDLV